MKAPRVGTVSFLRALRAKGFLQAVGDLWHEHGDVFEVAVGRKRMLFAMHPDAVQQVNVTNRKNYDKLGSYDGVRDYILGQGLVGSTGELWLRQRRLMAPFFTTKGVQDYAEIMLRDSEALGDRWDGLARSGEEVEIAEEMTQVTASIILRAMFSTGEMEEILRMKEAVETIISFANDRLAAPGLPLWVPTAANRRYKEARDFAHRTISGIIADRRTVDASVWPDDLLTRLMRARDEETGEPMSELLLRDESITIFFAGHETTARTMTFAWLALGQHPEVATRLHAELDAVIGDREPTVDDLRRLPYTLQVVKEVMRVYPAAPFYMRDAVGPDTIGGFDVAPGTGVMVSPYWTHRHPDFWEDPETFDPDRWTPDLEKARHRFAYHPFAAGPRTCLGNHFSLLETHLMLAVLAHRFAPRLRPGFVPQVEMQGVLGLANGLPMVVEARGRATETAAS
ncbi:MAG: cytochrome P450 [Alphaproteobacteria bacterium]|nr:cytochrome P450 [Alphaproteobacteria bacterium]